MLPTTLGAGQPGRRHTQVLRAIEAYLWRYDRPPTVRELCRETGILSISYVFFLLAELELDGYIAREPGASSSIRLARPSRLFIVGSIVGSIAAGMPQGRFDARAPETLAIAA